jgi:hypothetical protein
LDALMLRSARIALAFVSALLMACLAVPAAGAATKFDPDTWNIVMNKSIGGVKLGQSKAKAKNAWNGAAKCGVLSMGIQTCRWQGKEPEGHADYTLQDGKVITIAIDAGVKNGKDSIKKPLTNLRTPKGTKLGSKVDEVMKHYPGGQQIMATTDTPYVLFYRLNGGKTRLQFNSSGKLVSIVFATGITGV